MSDKKPTEAAEKNESIETIDETTPIAHAAPPQPAFGRLRGTTLPSSAPAAYDPNAVMPAIDLEMVDGSVIHATFDEDADATGFTTLLSNPHTTFVGVRDAESGESRTVNVANIKSTKVVGVAHPPAVAAYTPGARVPLKSSNLAFASYLPATKVLTVDFKSGRRYTYQGVEQNVFNGLISAQSSGKYFDQNIRSKYVEKELS